MTAYAVASPRLYKPAAPQEDPEYLNFLRTQPCAVFGCRSWYVEAAHIGGRGLSQKADDRGAIPLCRHHHRTGEKALHRIGPRRFQAHYRMNFRLLGEELNGKFESGRGGEGAMKMKRRTKFNVRPVEERWLMRNGSVAHITHRGGGFAAGMIEGSMAVCCWHHGETEAGTGYDLVSQMQEPAAGAGREICPACKGDGICPGGTSCRDRCGAMDANHICPKCRGAGVLPATGAAATDAAPNNKPSPGGEK